MQQPPPPSIGETIADLSPDAIVCGDASGTIAYWNRAAETLFGYSREGAIGQPLAILFPARRRAAYAGAFKRLLQGRHAAPRDETVEILSRHKSGREISLEVSITCSRHRGKTLVVAVARDATRRRSREAALLASRREAAQAADDARALHAQLQMAIDQLPEGIAFFDAERRYRMWNRRYAEMYPLVAELLTPGLPFETFLRACLDRGQLPDAVGREEEWLTRRLALNDRQHSTDLRRMPGDRWLRVEERRMPDGGRIGIRVDITDLKRREDSFRLLFDGNPVPMWLYDTETLQYLAVNDAALEHYRYSRERFLAMNALDLRPPEERAEAAETMRSVTSSYSSDRVWRHIRGDGSEIQAVIFGRALPYEGRLAVLVAAIDVTARVRSEERVTHMAHHDALTDLPNRALFRERLEEALDRKRKRATSPAADSAPKDVAVLFVDLDGFKPVNDTFGHGVGDAVLKVVAERLSGCMRENDTVARLGGDEFAILLPGVTGPEPVATVADRLVEAVSQPFVVGENRISVGASVGIAMGHASRVDPDLLLKDADVALYQAKADGRGTYRFFEPAMNLRVQLRHALEMDLRQALSRGELELHYQPFVDSRTRAIAGFEALPRWNHPDRGFIQPCGFMPLAEEIGLALFFGEWILRTACADAARWPGHVKVAVELPVGQLKAPGLVEAVGEALAASGLEASRLELAIAEPALVHDDECMLSALQRLRAFGVRLSLDDFGRGDSGLGYLRRFAFDKLKIDPALTCDLATNKSCGAIVRAIAALGTELGLALSARGVDSAEQFESVRAEGCTDIQGLFVGRAVPANGVPALLGALRTRKAAAA